MKRLCFFAAVVLTAASCDSSEPTEPPPTPSPPAEWRAGPCFDAPGAAALLIGAPAVVCVSEAGTFRAEFDTVGYYGGGTFEQPTGDDAIISLLNSFFQKRVYRLDLQTGVLANVSVNDVGASHTSRINDGLFMITDYLFSYSEKDPDEFAFSIFDGVQTQTTLRITIPDFGRVLIRDGDYNPETNTSAFVLITSPDAAVSLLVVDHDTGAYRFEDISYSNLPGSVRYTNDGSLYVMDNEGGRVHSVPDGRLVLDLGDVQTGATNRKLVNDSEGNVYTYTNGPDGARVVRLLPGGGTEEVFTTDRPQRAMAIAEATDTVCLREFRPYSAESQETYDDIVTLYSLRTGETTRYPVTLNTADHRYPMIACL